MRAKENCGRRPEHISHLLSRLPPLLYVLVAGSLADCLPSVVRLVYGLRVSNITLRVLLSLRRTRIGSFPT